MDYAKFDQNLKWRTFKAERVQRYNNENLTNYSGYSELLHKLTLKNWSCGNIAKMFNSSKNTIKHHLKRMGVDRLPHGGSHHRKLTISQAKMIKNANSLKEAQDLCTKYGVSKQIIYNIKHGKSWKNI